MNKKYISSLMIAAALCGLTACEDDRDDNPTLGTATEFVLNVPASAAQVVNLENSKAVHFTWSQPNWNFPIAVNYCFEYSLDDKYTVTTDQAAEDETGATKADFHIGSEVKGTELDVPADEIALAVMSIAQWTEDAVPEQIDVYVRLKATPATQSGKSDKTIYSNAVKIAINPYYIALKPAPVEIWYFVGAAVADGSWGNSVEGIGKSIYPMLTVKGYTYDKKTGRGPLSFKGYFPKDLGLKLIGVPGGWDIQAGSVDGSVGADIVFNDSGSKDIFLPASGYYDVKIDPLAGTASFTALEADPRVFDKIMISGEFNDWDENTEMTPVTTIEGCPNHLWYYLLDATEGPTKCKFLYTDWSPSWGGTSFPDGVSDSGADIQVAQGMWAVIFNDFDGSYSFIEITE